MTFSGDKLLGGPQAGIAAGGAAAIAKLRTHPLMRALRPDKLTIAALVATMAAYRDGTALETLPVWRLIAETTVDLGRRAKGVRRAGSRPRGIPAAVIETSSTVGGGSLPEEIPALGEVSHKQPCRRLVPSARSGRRIRR